MQKYQLLSAKLKCERNIHYFGVMCIHYLLPLLFLKKDQPQHAVGTTGNTKNAVTKWYLDKTRQPLKLKLWKQIR